MCEVPLYSDVLRPKLLKHKRGGRGARTPPALLSIHARPLMSPDVGPATGAAAAVPLATPLASLASATPLLGDIS